MSKIITIWGNPNSGKTLFSVKLAKELSKDKNGILVFTDIFTPPLDVVLPFENNYDKSLGKILETPILTQEDILKELIISKKNNNLAYLGFYKEKIIHHMLNIIQIEQMIW